jgi:hypothetical protein
VRPGLATAPAPAGRSLNDILASPRSDLAKAILLSEILGSPLAQRHGRVPRHRT